MTAKPNLILLHGALGSADQLSPLAAHLKEQFTVHCYDFPGHGGKSFAEHPLTIPILAEHLLDHLSEFHLIGSHVVGYSMGGYVALWLESKKPGIFSSIMTFGTKFSWSPEAAEKESKLIAPEFLEAKAANFVKLLQARHQPNDWKKLSKETSHLMTHLGNHYMTADDFEKIDIPVRITLGDRDSMVTLEETQHTFATLPKASLLVMPDTPHLFEKLNHTYLAEEISRFIHSHGV